jgi:hypothetical protein
MKPKKPKKEGYILVPKAIIDWKVWKKIKWEKDSLK